jgi:hypothetical protein
MHKRASDLEGCLGLELRVHLTGPEMFEVWYGGIRRAMLLWNRR